MKKILFSVGMAIGFALSASAQTYTVTLSANPTAGGMVYGGGVYQATDLLNTIEAMPNSGYSLMYWMLPSNMIVDQQVLNNSTAEQVAQQFGITDGNINLTAHFTNEQYTISATAFPAGAGTITGGGTFFAFQNTSLTATANSGYGFTTTWIAPDGTGLSSGNPYNLTVVADKEIIALFAKTGEAVVYTSASEGGTVSGGGVYPLNSPITLTATPTNGYTFVAWENVNGQAQVSTNSTYTFTPTAQTVLNLRAVFEETTADLNEISNTITVVYPNPTNSTLFIETKENTNITIVNFLGSAVATQELQTGNNTVDVGNLTNGVYFIQNANGGAVKFVKE